MQMVTPTQPATSLETLVHEHGRSVFRYLRSLVRDADTARDLAQDTFVRLHGRAHDAGPGLVFRTARSCAIDHLRRRQVRRRHLSGDEPPEVAAGDHARPDHDFDRRSLQADLLEALAQLPEDQRTVFHLSEIEGLAYHEIAQVLDVSPGTIASRKHHAVRKLRAILGRLGHGR